ncbi:leucine-rich repeat-containing protein 45 [Boleophthalmus pectinirostris]|uniref:leucine-rich repeat-containing protein 45 n=1 Tax=Boleophthalmus pectinirostris TaxID=150288 RepID=UPI000A1C352F|nr:leucine-rich repeat-containing protein 45 [Boleophthalmus pectinirostris]
MGDMKSTYLSLCRESGVEPQEGVLSQLQRGPRLDLSAHSLSADTCSVLSRTLHKNHSVTELLLSDCMLSEEGAIALLTGLIGNTSLKVLDLKGNNLRAAGAEVLGRMLAQNNSLNRLVLEWNALGLWDEAFSLFCEGLASNSSLKELDLRNNQINPQGASELSQALRRNNSLEMLDLRWNNIGLLGGRSLLEALQKNKCLVQLEMAGNNIPSDMVRALEQSTAHNSEQQNALRENRSRTQVLSKEIQILKEEKGRQFLSLMETIDRQRDEMGRSNRCTSVQMAQLQEALNERTSAVSSLTARLQMAEAALALSEQKNTNMATLLTQTKTEKEKLWEQHNREKKKEIEDNALKESKLLKEIQSLTNNNVQLRNKVEEMECRCKSQQQNIFELKQQLTNSTAELKIRLAQAEDRLDKEKLYSKQALENQNSLHHKEVENVNRHLEESERALQERIFKLETQRIQLEEEVSQAKALCASERAQAQEELSCVRAQLRLEEREQVSSLKEKLSSLRCSLQEAQLHASQQKDFISELQARSSQHSLEVDTLRRRIDELQQELSGKEQEKVVEVNKVRVELQEQIGRLETERAAQTGLKERIGVLEREMKVQSSNHREALRDKDSEITTLLEKVRLRDVQIQRITEAEAQRASYLQSAILTYVQSSPLGHFSSPNKPL